MALFATEQWTFLEASLHSATVYQISEEECIKGNLQYEHLAILYEDMFRRDLSDRALRGESITLAKEAQKVNSASLRWRMHALAWCSQQRVWPPRAAGSKWMLLVARKRRALRRTR